MKIVHTGPTLDAAVLELCCSVLKQGGIICYPTETFYGLGIDPENAKGRERLYRVKERAAEKYLPLIASDRAMVERFCETSDPRFGILAGRFWPGPLTLVLPLRDRTSTVAIRVSAYPAAREISGAFGNPIVSTSANRSGEPPVTDPAQLPQRVLDEVDILIDAGPAPGGAPSTIVSITGEAVEILREGAVPAAEVMKALRFYRNVPRS